VPADPPDEAFTGVPDSFGRLWTPHRMAYIKGEGKPSGPGEAEGCPFDLAPTLSDEDGLIVARGSLVYVVLNLYPYNAGHLLVVPYRHVPDYTDLTVPETAEFASYTQHAIGGRRRDRGSPAPARGAPVGRRHQLHARDRPHPRPAPAPG
jgi:ATP adenylyltransferase